MTGRVLRPTTVFEGLIHQEPALGAVFQCVHRVLHPKIAQGLCADDAAGAACAIDHHGCVRICDQVFQAQAQFAVGAAHCTGNVHLGELAQRPAVQHHGWSRLALPVLQLGRGNGWGVAGVFDQLAEGLGRHVHTREQHVARRLPALAAALQPVHIAVAQGVQALGGTLRHLTIVQVVHHQAHRRIRRQAWRFDLQTAVRQVDCEEQVRLAVLAVLAHVEQGDFLAVEQPVLEVLRGYARVHGNTVEPGGKEITRRPRWTGPSVSGCNSIPCRRP